MNQSNRTARLPLAAADLRRVAEPLNRAWTLPPAAYTDPEVFNAESQRIFQRDWICVARTDQLPARGDYVCVDLLDQPIVVVRGMDDQLRALSRICLHRAMPVVEASGNATRFVCPYHNWTYELDGRLRSAPMMESAEGFQADACRLPELALEEWQGFVMINLDPEAAPLTPQLAPLEAVFADYDLGSLVVATTLTFDSPWNWKILVENFMEAYHHIGTHRNSFELAYPARDSYVVDNAGGPWALLRMPGHEGPEAADGSGLPPFPGLDATQKRELLAAVVYPTLLFGASSDLAAWYQLIPAAHDRMQLKIHALLRPEVADVLNDTGRSAVADGLRSIHMEDIAANAGPWRGLQAPLTVQGRLSPYEKAIWQLNQLWLDRLGLA